MSSKKDDGNNYVYQVYSFNTEVMNHNVGREDQGNRNNVNDLTERNNYLQYQLEQQQINYQNLLKNHQLMQQQFMNALQEINTGFNNGTLGNQPYYQVPNYPMQVPNNYYPPTDNSQEDVNYGVHGTMDNMIFYDPNSHLSGFWS